MEPWLAEMSVKVFDEWFNHYMLEPWGYEAETYRHAELSTYLVNGLYHPKNPVKPSDFYPKKATEEVKEQSWQDMKSLLKGRSSNG